MTGHALWFIVSGYVLLKIDTSGGWVERGSALFLVGLWGWGVGRLLTAIRDRFTQRFDAVGKKQEDVLTQLRDLTEQMNALNARVDNISKSRTEST